MKDLSFLDDDAIADLGLDDPDVEDDGRALPAELALVVFDFVDDFLVPVPPEPISLTRLRGGS